MAAVKGKDTKPEMLVRRFLHGRGFRYGLHNKNLPGSPDIVLRRFKTVIFVHGCFWHGHEDCKYYRLPKSNIEFWQTKIDRNRTRDKRDIQALHELGWRVIVIWECQLKPKISEHTRYNNLRNHLMGHIQFNHLIFLSWRQNLKLNITIIINSCERDFCPCQ